MEVAAERLLGGPDLAPDALELGSTLRFAAAQPPLRLDHRRLEQIAPPVGLQKRPQDRLVELVGGQALGVAGFLAVLDAAVAGVIAVSVAVALGRGTDEMAAAALADDQASEQVVGAVGAAFRVALAALLEERLNSVEGAAVDEYGVG